MKNETMALIVVVIVIISAIFYFESGKVSYSGSSESGEINVAGNEITAMKESKFPKARELVSPEGFINTDSITISENIGKKVILVDFWTYSCINCQRTIPYLNEWYDKYKDEGLIIIGVHTPEFEFEKDYDNVKKAVEKYGIKYPVVQDNEYGTWRAYRNQYWPRKYLIDIDGFIVYDHIGEGGYEETEKEIQKLLEERAERLNENLSFSSDISNPSDKMNVEFEKIKSPETYFGSARNIYLYNGIYGREGVQQFDSPEKLKENKLYLGGEWNFTQEYAESVGEDSKVFYSYSAKNVYIVASSEKETIVSIYLDDKFVKNMTVKDHDLYSVVEGDSYGNHILRMDVKDKGVQFFAFTFG